MSNLLPKLEKKKLAQLKKKLSTYCFRSSEVFGWSEVRLSMSEELTVFDSRPNPDVEMCNGTARTARTTAGGDGSSRSGRLQGGGGGGGQEEYENG